MKTNEVKHSFFNDPAAYLRDLLIERKHRNPNYSASAMARDLELSAPFLSQVMGGRRNLSLEQKLKLAERLNLETSVEEGQDSKKFELIQNTLEHEKIVRYWYHFAILELCQLPKNSSNPLWIAERLGISMVEAQAALDRLIEFGYLEITKNKCLKRTGTAFVFNAKQSSANLRALHRSRLQAAEVELESFTPDRVLDRNFQTIFVATSHDRMKTAKKMVDEFTQKLMKHLTDGEPETVFQYSTQLFCAENKPRIEPKKGK